MDKKGRPYCFIKFHDANIPKTVLSDEIVLDDRPLRVELAKGQPIRTACGGTNGDFALDAECPISRSTGPNAALPENVYVGNSTPTAAPSIDTTIVAVSNLNGVFVSEKLLAKYFAKYGTIEQIKMILSSGMATDQCTNSNFAVSYALGNAVLDDAFAVIKFEDAMCAQRAIFNEDGKAWLGKTIKLEIFKGILPTSFRACASAAAMADDMSLLKSSRISGRYGSIIDSSMAPNFTGKMNGSLKSLLSSGIASSKMMGGIDAASEIASSVMLFDDCDIQRVSTGSPTSDFHANHLLGSLNNGGDFDCLSFPPGFRSQHQRIGDSYASTPSFASLAPSSAKAAATANSSSASAAAANAFY